VNLHYRDTSNARANKNVYWVLPECVSTDCRIPQLVWRQVPVVVSWSLTSPFSTNMAISETKGQGWRAIPTQWRKASDILTSTLAALLLTASSTPTGQPQWKPHRANVSSCPKHWSELRMNNSPPRRTNVSGRNAVNSWTCLLAWAASIFWMSNSTAFKTNTSQPAVS